MIAIILRLFNGWHRLNYTYYSRLTTLSLIQNILRVYPGLVLQNIKNIEILKILWYSYQKIVYSL